MFEPDNMKDIYDAYPDEPVVGVFAQCQPMLFVKDLRIIEDVLVKSFHKFPNRGLHTNPYLDPMSEDLFLVKDPKWKPLRKNLSPVFTSAKLKQMFDAMSECTDRFIKKLNDAAKKNQQIEFCELTAEFTTDVVALCFFDIHSNTLLDENSEFQKIVPGTPTETETAEELTRIQIVKSIFLGHLSSIKGLLKLNSREDEFFLKVIKNSMEYRRKNGIKKNDFLDLLINLKDHPEQLERKRVSDSLLLAQALLFFESGQEPTSLTITHALYELALNSDIQSNLRNEITKASHNNDGKLDYNSVNSANYLDKIVKETFRKYPAVAHLIRKAEREHTFNNTNITVSRKRHVVIPIRAIHHDPKIYPEPEKFDPERFDEKTTQSRPRVSYLPFGDGPRNCIGQRFVQSVIKLCLAVAVTNFEFQICKKTFKMYKPDKSHGFLAPDGGLYLRVKKI